LYLLHRDIAAMCQYWEESKSTLDTAALKRNGPLRFSTFQINFTT
ncbi:hypothetical protein T4D_13341, partial [Trichinella pseudospiralis]